MTNTAYISLAILSFINLINFVDRYTIAGVLIDISHYYDMSNMEGGLLQTVFIISYMIFAPLFGYLGDRYSRKLIMSVGVLLWSLTTFGGSMIPQNHKWAFFLMRAMVGIGEASYSTVAPTIIADLFAKGMRTKMLSVFYFAIPVGSGLGYVVGDAASKWFGGWWWALRVTPPLGVICVFLIMVVLHEPSRGESDGVWSHEDSTLKQDLLYIIKIKSYVYSTLGFTCCVFVIGAMAWWAPTYMEYALIVHGSTSNNSIAFIFGGITVLGGILGVVIGSASAMYHRKTNPRADALICGIGVFLSIPFVFFALIFAASYPLLTWFFIAVGVTLLFTNWVLVADILMYVIVPNKRSLAQSIQILISHLLGDACSPFIVGAISDGLQGNIKSEITLYMSLQYGMYLPCFLLVFGGYAFMHSSFYIVYDRKVCRVKTRETSTNPSDANI